MKVPSHFCAGAIDWADAAKGFATEDVESDDASPKTETELVVLVVQTGALFGPAREFANAEPCPVNAVEAEEGLAWKGRRGVRAKTTYASKHGPTHSYNECTRVPRGTRSRKLNGWRCCIDREAWWWCRGRSQGGSSSRGGFHVCRRKWRYDLTRHRCLCWFRGSRHLS